MARRLVRPAKEQEPIINNTEAVINAVLGLHTNKDGYLTCEGELWHRMVWEDEHGFPPPDGWHIHHINSKKQDNRLENLIALPEKLHSYIHAAQMYHNRRFKRLELEDLLTRHLRGEKLDAKGIKVRGRSARDIWAAAKVKRNRKAWLKEQKNRTVTT